MGNKVNRIAIVPVIGFLLLSAAGAAGKNAVRILMIAGTTSDHLPMSMAGKPVIEKMGLDNGFTVDYSTDPAVLNDTNLVKYQVILQMNLYPFNLSAPQRGAFEKFIAQGKGWVGVHAAGCAQADWAWYMDFLGGITWVSHADFRSGNLIFEDRTHPITRNMPASMIIKDEWYRFSKSPRANVHVLAKADEANYAPTNPQGDHPMVWTNLKFPRTVYCSIGHDPDDWKNPDYILLIHDALIWAMPGGTGILPSFRTNTAALPAAGGLGPDRDALGRTGFLLWKTVDHLPEKAVRKPSSPALVKLR